MQLPFNIHEYKIAFYDRFPIEIIKVS